MRRRTRARLVRGALYAIALGVVVAVGLAVDWERFSRAFLNVEIARRQFPLILTQAARNTLIFTVFGFAGGLALGLTLALMRLSSVRPYRWFAAVYIDVFRGLPMLLTILIIGFGLPIALGVRIPPRDFGAGITALAIVAGAYIAEVLRAGIEAVPRGQMEAARSLGMSHPVAMVTVVIPQALRIVIPPLTNELVLLLKDTSLLAVLGVTAANRELVKFARDGVSATANSTPFVVAGLVYLAMTIPLTRLVGLLETRVRAAR